MNYSIVIPCYNESGNITSIINRFSKFREKYDFELIVVNNGSTDDTVEVLKELMKLNENNFIKICQLDVNRGYGYGIRKGLNQCKGNILAFTHADAQTPPEDVFRAFDAYEKELQRNGSKLLVKGHRKGRDKVHATTRGLAILTKYLTGMEVQDINGQPKVFGRELLDHMLLDINNFGFDPYVLHLANASGWRICSIEVSFEERGHGVSKSAENTLRKLQTIVGFMYSLLRFTR